MSNVAEKAFLAALSFLLILASCANENAGVKPEQELPFDRMTPAQHLQKAKDIVGSNGPSGLSNDQIQNATRHLSAIPDKAPEAVEALALQKQWVQAAQEEYLEKTRQSYTNTLETKLKEQGLDIVVTEVGDQLILADDLFKEEANRVQFLSTIRKIRDTQGLCQMGFRRVALGGNGVLADSHIYSLECRSPGSHK